MLGLMQQRPLLVSSLVDYASTWHCGREIVSRDAEGGDSSLELRRRRRRARSRSRTRSSALGVGRGDRVATLAWNSHRHLELYYGVTSSGRVLHTVNPRLFPDQIQYIMHHAEDAYVFFDPVFAPLVEALAPSACRWCAAGSRCAAGRPCRPSSFPGSSPRGPSGDGLARITNGRSSTRTRPRRSATPPARPAIRRA